MNYDYFLTIDYNTYEILNGLVGQSSFLDNFMVLIAKYGPLIFDLYLVYLWFRGTSKEELEINRKRAIYAAFSALVALGINQIFAHLYLRDRPYVHHPAHLLLPYSPDPSFPSDHAAGGFSIATGVLLGRTLPGIALLIFAAILAISRVYVGIHYPSDILGGAVVGIFGAFIVERCQRILERPIYWVFLLWRHIEDKIPFLKAIKL